MKKLELKSKSKLIEWLSGSQILLMALALVIFGYWTRAGVGKIMREQMLFDNRLIAEQMGRLLAELHDGQVDFGDSNWERIQTFVEKTKLPNAGYLCIADSTDGRLLCHPKLRSNPSLRDLSLANVELRDQDTRIRVFDLLKSNSKRALDATGILGSGASTEVVSTAYLQNIQGVLFVHQSENSVQRAVSSVVTPLGYAGMVVGLVLVLVTSKTSSSIVKRYEHELVAINASLEDTVRKRTSALMKTRNAVIFGLAKLAESRDSDTGEHLDRIRIYSTELAKTHARKHSSLTQECVDSIGLASSLHDIGKVGVPDSVLLKPGRLDADERKIIEIHPTVGAECLDMIEGNLGEDGFLALSRDICAYHHEKWDGSGYPHRSSGESIPIAARIVAVTDVYDALRSKRPYKEPMTHLEACTIIIEGSGTHFDPQVVDSFVECHRTFLEVSERYVEDARRSLQGKDDATKENAERLGKDVIAMSGVLVSS
jgi:response regulator RpfG family c-di-GMP phosphodiesterase